MSVPPLNVRPATDDDRSFVMATWVNSRARAVRDRRRHATIVAFLSTYVDPIMRESPRIYVLCSIDQPSALHGHVVVARDGVVAWVYVTLDLRGNGYARQLLSAARGSYQERIPVHFQWPFESKRFIFQKYVRAQTSRPAA